MASKLVAPDSGCVGVDMPDGTTYDRDRSGHYQVENPRHERLMRGDGWFTAGTSLAGSHVLSYWCPECQFNSVFRRCGRCGADLTQGETHE